MIQKLRRQFILIAMSSTFAVLFIIIGTLNILNYASMVRQKDDILTILSQNQGRFPAMFGPKREMREDESFSQGKENMNLPWKFDGEWNGPWRS